MRYEVLGIAIDAVTLNEAADMIERMYSSERLCRVFYCNPEIAVRAHRDAHFRRTLQSGDLIFPDGAGLVFFGGLAGARFKERIAGIDLLMRACEISARLKKSVFLFGGEKDIAQRAGEVLCALFPGLKIAGILNGYEGAALVLQQESLCSADAIFVGLGTPLQEEWIMRRARNFPRLRVAMAVGGAFDMLAGATPRAPRFLQKAGLEWLWRFAQEPKKRWRRMVNAVIVFPAKVLWCQAQVQNAKRETRNHGSKF